MTLCKRSAQPKRFAVVEGRSYPEGGFHLPTSERAITKRWICWVPS